MVTQKRRDADQKERVRQNKKEFVLKMLPIVDSFRGAPVLVPAQTDKEATMHSTFGALLNAIMIQIEKFGFKEFSASPGDKLDALRHQVVSVEDDGTEGLVLSVSHPGMVDAEGDVIRKCAVVASGKTNALMDSQKTDEGQEALDIDDQGTDSYEDADPEEADDTQ